VTGLPFSLAAQRALLADMASRLAAHGIAEAAREARLLLGAALGVSQEEIVCGLLPLTPQEEERVESLLARRCRREPLAYILGEREFWGLRFAVNPAVLIPRPDTETLIECALSLFRRHAPQRILDLGTGSGALLLAALSLFPESRGVGVDLSAEALAVAEANAQALGLADRARFLEGSWESEAGGSFDLVLCNPPYIRRGEIAALDPEVRDFEPRLALDGGEDGLAAYRVLLPALHNHLTEEGIAILEIGQGQAGDVTALARECGLVLRAVRVDLGGIARALAFRRG